MEWIVEAEDIGELLDGRFTVQTKPLVRCKDCKHYIYDGDRWLCKVLSNNYEPIVDLEVDGYCSKCERRADGEIH